jgi:hypothetical protein
MEGLERRICMDAPTVTDAEFIFDAWPTRQTISLVFSDDVRQSLDEQDITLENLTTGEVIPRNRFNLDYDQDTNVASITFTGSLPFHALPDGNYRLTLPDGSVEDEEGNELESAFAFEFFVLAGDANHDREVNLVDLGILATNFGRSDRTFAFSEGDFTYDGKVDLADLGVLAGNFGKALPEPTPEPELESDGSELSLAGDDEAALVSA